MERAQGGDDARIDVTKNVKRAPIKVMHKMPSASSSESKAAKKETSNANGDQSYHPEQLVDTTIYFAVWKEGE